MKRLIDAENLKKEIKSAFYGNIGLTVTSAVNEVIDRQPTIYPENLRPVGWWRYNKKTRSWHCGRCGWKNPLMSPDGPSPDGEPFPHSRAVCAAEPKWQVNAMKLKRTI